MKKGLKIFIIVILVIFIIPYAYLSLSGGPYDNIEELMKTEPMSSAERYQISSKDKTVSVKLDKADLYYCLSSDDVESPLDDINDEISEYGINIEKLGLFFEGSSGYATAKLKYKNFLPIPAKCMFSIRQKGDSLVVQPEEIKVAGLIKLDQSLFADEDIEIDLTDIYPFFEDTVSVSAEKDVITLTIPYPVKWLTEEMSPEFSDYTMIVDFVDPEEIEDSVLPEMLAYNNGDASKLEEKIDSLEGVPGGFVNLKKQIIAISGAYTASRFFNGEGCGSIPRLFPEITEEAVKEERQRILDSYQQLYDERTGKLAQAGWEILQAYADGTITASGAVFKYKDTGETVDVISMPCMEGAGDWLNLESVRVIMGKNPGDYLLHQTPKGMSVPVIMLRVRSGRPVVCYQFTSKQYKVRSITEKEYEKFINASSIPTFDLDEKTTQR